MKRISYLFALAALIFQIGCGPKVSDVFKKYEGEFKKKREQFQSIAGALPEKGGANAEKNCPNMNPAIEFNEKTRQFNTEMVMFEQLSDPDAKPKMDILPKSELLNSIQWTGPKNPMSTSVLDDRAGDTEDRLKAALAYRYLVVSRAINLTEPVALDEKTYTPGKAKIETSIVDLTNNQPLCSFVIDAKSASAVEYSYKGNESKQKQLENFAHSTLWEDARKQTIEQLKQKVNAKIELTSF
ncbi:MAG: hypothetical protein ABWZ66_08385 [Pyrinomonadaceae bacterium]